jgi:4-oxalocrotonate tautomerase
MPHVVVKMYAGKSEQQKARLAQEITKAVMSGAGCTEEAVSVAIEDVQPADWVEKVFKPEIKGNWDRVYKKPGYDPA